MRFPEEVRKRLQQAWARNTAAWIADPSGAAVSVPLHPPTGAEALADPTSAHTWIDAWRSTGLLAEFVAREERRWANLGTQLVPVRWQAGEAGALCRLAGEATRAEWAVLLGHAEAAVEALAAMTLADDASSDLRSRVATAITRRRAQWLQMPSVDADLCVRAAAWLLAHPGSGYRIRQVPLPGMHTKWLKDHRAVVEGLVGAARADGSTELGLRPAPTFHDLVVLDPPSRAERPGLPRSSRMDPEALAATGLHPRVVIVCENSETVQVLPDLPGTVAVGGTGYNLSELFAVPWIQRAPVLYWGDIDADGLRILDRARHHHSDVRSVLMDRATLDAHQELTGSGGERSQVVLTHLTAAEAELYRELSATGLRLEQERIELGYAVEQLRRTLDERLHTTPPPYLP